MAAGDIKYEKGLWVITGEAGEVISTGDILSYDSADDDWVSAGDSVSGVIGVAVEDADDGDEFRVLRSGVVEVDEPSDLDADNAYEVPEYPGEVGSGNIVIYLM